MQLHIPNRHNSTTALAVNPFINKAANISTCRHRILHNMGQVTGITPRKDMGPVDYGMEMGYPSPGIDMGPVQVLWDEDWVPLGVD